MTTAPLSSPEKDFDDVLPHSTPSTPTTVGVATVSDAVAMATAELNRPSVPTKTLDSYAHRRLQYSSDRLFVDSPASFSDSCDYDLPPKLHPRHNRKSRRLQVSASSVTWEAMKVLEKFLDALEPKTGGDPHQYFEVDDYVRENEGPTLSRSHDDENLDARMAFRTLRAIVDKEQKRSQKPRLEEEGASGGGLSLADLKDLSIGINAKREREEDGVWLVSEGQNLLESNYVDCEQIWKKNSGPTNHADLSTSPTSLFLKTNSTESSKSSPRESAAPPLKQSTAAAGTARSKSTQERNSRSKMAAQDGGASSSSTSTEDYEFPDTELINRKKKSSIRLAIERLRQNFKRQAKKKKVGVVVGGGGESGRLAGCSDNEAKAMLMTSSSRGETAGYGKKRAADGNATDGGLRDNPVVKDTVAVVRGDEEPLLVLRRFGSNNNSFKIATKECRDDLSRSGSFKVKTTNSSGTPSEIGPSDGISRGGKSPLRKLSSETGKGGEGKVGKWEGFWRQFKIGGGRGKKKDKISKSAENLSNVIRPLTENETELLFRFSKTFKNMENVDNPQNATPPDEEMDFANKVFRNVPRVSHTRQSSPRKISSRNSSTRRTPLRLPHSPYPSRPLPHAPLSEDCTDGLLNLTRSTTRPYSEKSDREKDELFEKIAEQLALIADSYSAPRPPPESLLVKINQESAENEQSEERQPLYSAAEIGEDLTKVANLLERPDIDQFERLMVEPGEGVVSAGMEEAGGLATANTNGWRRVARMFRLSERAVRMAGVGSVLAGQIKLLTLNYFEITFADWVAKQGGWDAVVGDNADDNSELD